MNIPLKALSLLKVNFTWTSQIDVRQIKIHATHTGRPITGTGSRWRQIRISIISFFLFRAFYAPVEHIFRKKKNESCVLDA